MKKTLQKNAECTELMLDLFLNEAELSTRELYKRALNIVVKISDSKMGFFHQVSDNQREIIFTTWNEEALKNYHSISDNHYPVNSAGIWADCIREKRPVICNNLLQAKSKTGFPPGHPHISRMLSVPLIQQDKVKLIFVLGNKEVDYDETDLARVEAVINELHKVFRKRSAESALKKREERLNQILEGSELLIWEVDQKAMLTYVSYSKVSFLGRTIEEVVGNTHLFDFIDAEESTLQNKAWEMFSQQHSFSNFIHPSRHKDGHIVFLETNGMPFFDEKGLFLGYRGATKDVTKRMQTEIQLHSSEERWRSIVKTSPDGISITTAEGIILYVSDILFKWHGFQEESEMIGRSIFDFVTRETVGVTESQFAKLLAGENPRIIDRKSVV